MTILTACLFLIAGFYSIMKDDSFLGFVMFFIAIMLLIGGWTI